MHLDMDCGGKRSATTLWIGDRQAKALSPLRSASALQMVRLATFHNGACAKLRPASVQPLSGLAARRGRCYAQADAADSIPAVVFPGRVRGRCVAGALVVLADAAYGVGIADAVAVLPLPDRKST